MTKNKTKPLTMLMAGLLLTNLAQAQESTNASGGNAIGSGGTVAYSVGQVFYTIDNGSSGTITQGVQQVYVISTIGIKETALTFSLNAFPNPTKEHLSLQVSDYNNEDLSYQLVDFQGKQLVKAQIIGNQTQIEMKSLPNATYYVNVLNHENKKVQTFKIIKQ